MIALVADGNLLLATLVALLAGVVSFASPCVLPLVPGFLGYVAALPARVPGRGADLVRHPPYGSPSAPKQEAATASAGRGRALLGATLFVLGFSVVFLAGTLAASAVGVALVEHRRVLSQVGGVVVIALALVFLGVGGQSSWSPRWRPSAGLAGAPLLGMVFAIGWAPCMGPTLAVIYALSTNLGGDASAMARGLALGVAYCVGLGLPFLALAAGWSRANAASAWLRRHRRGMKVFGGSLLLVVGVLLVTGWWDVLVVHLQATLVGSFIPVL